MAECMIKLLSKKGTIIIEIQYLLNTLKDLTFDNIYHEHYNYWSLTSLINFFNQFDVKIFKADKNINVSKKINKILNEEEKYGIKNFKVYKKLEKKFIK